MKKLSIYCSIGLCLFVLMFSCKKETIQKNNESVNAAGDGRDPGGSAGGSDVVAVLYTSDGLDAGTIKITNDLNYIYVTYTTVPDYTFVQTDLYVGTDNGVPTNTSGMALPTSFPYVVTQTAGTTTYTYTIPVGVLYNIGGCGSISAHGVVVGTDGIQKHVWSAGVPVTSTDLLATRTPYCLAGFVQYIPQPCPISFKRNNGNGTCGQEGQIRLSFKLRPEESPILDSIYYEGSKITGRTYALPDATPWLQKGYISYCVLGGNLPPAKKLVLYFSYANHQVCTVNEW